MTVKTQQIYYDLLLQGYMFRLLRFIIRPSNEPTQNYLIPSALRDPVALIRLTYYYTTYCKRYGIPQCTRN